MPWSTGRTRALSVTASGTFQGHPEENDPSLGGLWRNFPQVARASGYSRVSGPVGTHHAAAFLTLHVESGPLGHRRGVRATLKLYLRKEDSLTTLTGTGDVAWGAWQPSAYSADLREGAGEWEVTATGTLRERTGGAFGDYRDTSEDFGDTAGGPVVFTGSASASFVVRFTYPGGATEDVTATASVSGTRTRPVLTPVYGWVLTLAAYNGGTAEGAVSVTADGLAFPSGSYSLTQSGSTLTGGANSARYTSTNAFLADLGARVDVSAKWALEVTPGDRRYGDGAAVSPTINVEGLTGGSVPATLTGGLGTTRFPSGSDFYYGFTARCNGLQQALSNGVAFPGAFGSVRFAVNRAWADGAGIRADSQASRSSVGWGRSYPVAIGPEFDALRLTFAAEHPFSLFADAADWAVLTNGNSPTFWGANTRLRGTGAVSLDAGALKVACTAADLLVLTKASADNVSRLYGLRHWAYRYARLRVKASIPNARLRFVVGHVESGAEFGRSAQPAYAWEVTTGAVADTYANHTLDLALPDLKRAGSVAGISAVSWEANEAPVHPARFAIPSSLTDNSTAAFRWQGLPVYVECLDVADYWLESLTGFYETGADRLPLLLTYPLDNAGDAAGALDLNAYEAQASDPTYRYVARVVVNGARAFDFGDDVTGGSSYLAFGTFWERLRQRLDTAANDTGITAATPASAWRDNIPRFPGQYQPLQAKGWQAVTPGSMAAVEGRYNVAHFQGYPGMGDVESGAYGSLLQVRLGRLWDGERLGLAYWKGRTLRGVPVELRDNDTGALVVSGETNADGLYRLFAKYGVKLPKDNSGNAEYSGGATNPTYTTEGKTLNSYWLKGARLTGEKDEDGYLSEEVLIGFVLTERRRDFSILERWPAWEDLGGVPVPLGGDLLQTANGWLVRAYADSEGVKVERSLDAGSTWAGETVAADMAEDAAPALVVTRHDELLVWYHDADGDTQAYRSGDYGETWTHHATHAGKVYPRPVLTLEGLLLFAHDNDETLTLYASDDFGVTLTARDFTLPLPPQRVEFRVDRRGWLHLVTQVENRDIEHRYAADGSGHTWSAAAVLASGEKPAFALGIDGGVLAWFDADALHTRVVDETGRALVVGDGASVPIDYEPQYLGALIDSRGQAWLEGAGADEAREPVWSGSVLTSWQAPS